MKLKLAFLFLWTTHVFGACNCLVTRSVCGEVADSNLVFIGTVEAIQPSLLDQWKPGFRPDWMNAPDILALKKVNSPKALEALKARYLQLLPDLPAYEKLRLALAKNQHDLQDVMDWIRSQGTQVRFKVRTLFQQKKDSDDDDAGKKSGSADVPDNRDGKDDAPAPSSLEIWNEAGECGIPFQVGETYVVYAVDDEESEHPYTSVCHRTARLSDAGDDLSYLYFFEHDHANSARLEGFLTSDLGQLQFQPFHYLDHIGSPVRSAIVELKSTQGTRYTEADSGGRFVFDGLSPGDYDVTAWESGFPQKAVWLAGPRKMHVQPAQCVLTNMLVSTRNAGH